MERAYTSIQWIKKSLYNLSMYLSVDAVSFICALKTTIPMVGIFTVVVPNVERMNCGRTEYACIDICVCVCVSMIIDILFLLVRLNGFRFGFWAIRL